MHCYLLFQSLVNSPVAKTDLPIFLQQLLNETELQQNVNSSANLAAIVNILHNISAIPADASKSIIKVRFYFKAYQYLSSSSVSFVKEGDIVPEELSQLVSFRNRRELREGGEMTSKMK